MDRMESFSMGGGGAGDTGDSRAVPLAICDDRGRII